MKSICSIEQSFASKENAIYMQQADGVVRCLELFIIVTNNALYVKNHENLVLLFYDVILKYDVLAYKYIVANGI